MSMYGGGFATIPAYLRDIFGDAQVGAIHGRLLLAWSAAAILGPVLVNYIRAYQIETLQLPSAQVYSITMYIMAGLLVIGFILNQLIKPVSKKYFKNLEIQKSAPDPKQDTFDAPEIEGNTVIPENKLDLQIILAWLFVGVPLVWGIFQTLLKSFALFN